MERLDIWHGLQRSLSIQDCAELRFLENTLLSDRSRCQFLCVQEEMVWPEWLRGRVRFCSELAILATFVLLFQGSTLRLMQLAAQVLREAER